MQLAPEQVHGLSIVGRTASALSLCGVITIIVTFCYSPNFRSPTHRIIFINAFFNFFDFVATMISVSGPAAGDQSALCKFQAFSLQMFPPADVLWTLAMAWDVFLVVFYRYDTQDLRRLEIKYIGVITTITFIPAFVFLFIKSPEKGPMYGSVKLWCAISPEWVMYRIIFYYGPIWFIVLVVLLFYCLIGFEIFKLRYEFDSTRNTHIALSSNLSESNDSLQNSSDSTAKDIETHPSPRPRTISFRKYLLMPLLFFLALLTTWVAPSVNRISAFRFPGQETYGLLLAVAAMGSLRGFWNGVIFVTMGMKRFKRT